MTEPQRAPAWERSIPSVLLAWGTWSAFGPMLASGFAWTPGDLGDSRFVNYLLEHVYQWMLGRGASLWDPPMFYPTTNALAFSHVLVSPAPLYAVPRLLGAPPDLAYQIWLLLVGMAGFLVAYLLLSRPLGLRPLAAGGGAFLFAFGSPRLCQLNHAQLWVYFFGVVAVYAAVRIFGAGASRLPVWLWIHVLALSFALQLWADFYPGWFLALGFGLAVVLASVPYGTRRALVTVLAESRWAWLSATLLGAALTVPLAHHYLAAVGEVGHRDFVNTVPLFPKPASWIYMGSGSWLYGWMDRLDAVKALSCPWEHALGIGLVTGLLVVAGFVGARRQRLPVLVAATALAMIGLLSEPIWMWVGPHVPGSVAVRALARVGVFLLLPAAIGIGLFLSRVRRSAAAIAVLVVMAAEQRQARSVLFAKSDAARGVAAVAAAVDRACPAFFYAMIEVPGGFDPSIAHIDAIWAALTLNIPTVNGYSGNQPRGWSLGDNRVSPGGDDAALKDAVAAWMRVRGAADRKVCWVTFPDPRVNR